MLESQITCSKPLRLETDRQQMRLDDFTNSSPDRRVTMPSAEKIDTRHKALTLNLDPTTFGSFAEIGAGQEVARWFLIRLRDKTVRRSDKIS
jgi:hypothetical protein